MTTIVFTKKDVSLMSAEALIGSIAKIETELPGWVWSISQIRNRIRMTVIPGRNCPNPHDIAFAKTKEGDEGFHFTSYHCAGYPTEAIVDHFVGYFITHIVNKARDSFKHDHPEIVDCTTGWMRKQTPDMLARLAVEYDKFLQEISFIESKGHLLKELYFGSCDLSADCSIRGTRESNDSEFDISVDLLDQDCGIVDSLHESMIELKNDILTPVRETCHENG